MNQAAANVGNGNGAGQEAREREKFKNPTEWAQQKIAGSFADQTAASEKLKQAARYCHLIGGASMAPLVVGHEIVISIVPINRNDLYPANPAARATGGAGGGNSGDGPPRWGVGKSTLMSLAAAAGVEWVYSKRQDNGRDPLYCHWRVKGKYRQIDGTWRTIEGDRDNDMRDGSAQLHRKSENEVAQLRQNVLRSAITKAKLRAIREAFGLQHGMLAEDLDKPLVFARMVFTGRSDDPKIAHLFAAVVAQQHLVASGALFGPGLAPQLNAAIPTTAPINPIATATSTNDIDEPPDADDDFDDGQSGSPPPPAAAAPPANAGASRAPNAAAQPPRGGWAIPGGKEKGTPIAKATDATLAWWANRIEQNLASGDSKFADKDRVLLAALQAEIALRAKSGEVEEPQQDEPEVDRGPDPEAY